MNQENAMPSAEPAADEVQEIFDRIDENGDRRISFEEFARLMLEMDGERTDTALRNDFALIDPDRDGFATIDDFRAWVAPQGDRLTPRR
jgi:Ca2+-binding EF-hand superfamily protein